MRDVSDHSSQDERSVPMTEGRQSMTLAEAQERVDRWINTIGVRYFSELTNLAQLVEEVGELARIMSRTYGDQSFKRSDEAYNLADELADVLFVLICIANQTGVDLNDALERSLEKKTGRDRDRHQNNPKLSGEPEA
jgi:NTP pyrophosphatase (non-canonical NTP hydrolase)